MEKIVVMFDKSVIDTLRDALDGYEESIEVSRAPKELVKRETENCHLIRRALLNGRDEIR